MKRVIKKLRKTRKNLFGSIALRRAIALPNRSNIFFLKRVFEIQLSVDQLMLISEQIVKNDTCKLLVFGLGYDSLFWNGLNKNGQTIFIEDHEGWYNQFVQSTGYTNARLVDYNTKIRDYKKYLESPESMTLDFLPEEVTKEKWDVILVDAPGGWSDDTPGRMKSIYAASKLARDMADVFVHDCNREVEAIFSHKFLNKENMLTEIKPTEKIGDLRHYQVK